MQSVGQVKSKQIRAVVTTARVAVDSQLSSISCCTAAVALDKLWPEIERSVMYPSVPNSLYRDSAIEIPEVLKVYLPAGPNAAVSLVLLE